MVRGGVHVAVRQHGRVLEGDGLPAAPPLVRTLLRVVHLEGNKSEGFRGLAELKMSWDSPLTVSARLKWASNEMKHDCHMPFTTNESL